MQRFKTMVNVPVALGFGIFMAWREALLAFLFPVSNGVAFSPLVCQWFASCLVLVVALAGVAKNRGSFSVRPLNVLAAASVALATLSGVALVAVEPASPIAYGAATVIGVAMAALLYVWADVVAGLPSTARIGTLVAGLLVSSLVGIAMGQFVSAALRVAVVVLGAFAFAGLYLAARTFRERGGEVLMIRPTSSNHFKLLMLAVVLYALVFGCVSGTTAMQATPESTHQFTLGMSVAMAAVSLVLLVLAVAAGRPVSLMAMGRFLTPVLALLFLLHILLGGSANGWLPRLTLGFWQLVQVFVLLLLIEVAQGGTASLSFAFPLGWSVVSFGFACGALLGQMTVPAWGIGENVVQGIAVVLTIIAVIASSILAAAQYPRPAVAGADPEGTSWKGDPARARMSAGTEGGREGARAAQDAVLVAEESVRRDPIVGACAQLVQRYVLSEREREVLDLLARGNTRASIAEKLCISENTVRVHVKNIYAKLHIHSKQQLIDMVDRLLEPVADR